MAVRLGKNFKVYIGDANTPTEAFTDLGGQTTLSWNRVYQSIDTSTKDNGIYGSATSGLQNINMSVSGKLDLPDVAFEDLYGYAKSGTPEFNIEVREGTTVKYKGKVAVSGTFSVDTPYEGAVEYSFELTNVDVPVTDNLTA